MLSCLTGCGLAAERCLRYLHRFVQLVIDHSATPPLYMLCIGPYSSAAVEVGPPVLSRRCRQLLTLFVVMQRRFRRADRLFAVQDCLQIRERVNPSETRLVCEYRCVGARSPGPRQHFLEQAFQEPEKVSSYNACC